MKYACREMGSSSDDTKLIDAVSRAEAAIKFVRVRNVRLRRIGATVDDEVLIVTNGLVMRVVGEDKAEPWIR